MGEEQNQEQAEETTPQVRHPNLPTDPDIPVVKVPRGRSLVLFFYYIDNSITIHRIFPFANPPRPAEYVGGSGTIHNNPKLDPNAYRYLLTRNEGPARREWFTIRLTNAPVIGHKPNPWQMGGEAWLCPSHDGVPTYEEIQHLAMTAWDWGNDPSPITREYSFAVDCLETLAEGEPDTRASITCDNPACRDFMKQVPANHEHWFRCDNAACKDFQQFVPPNHEHWLKCDNASCKDFQKFVPPNHQHHF